MSTEVSFPERLDIGSRHILKGDARKNLCQWKLRPAEALSVVGSDTLYRARLVRMGTDEAEVIIYEEMGAKEVGPCLTLLQAVPEKERMELIIQKTCELGVDTIVPFTSSKSVTMAERDSLQKKSHRWIEIARKAAIQSRRSTIPEVRTAISFDEALASANGALKLIFWEKADKELRDVLKSVGAPDSVYAAIGPEGGFDLLEVQRAASCGFIPVRNNGRVMRTETAAINAVSILRYALKG